jgi:hypothetical protein
MSPCLIARVGHVLLALVDTEVRHGHSRGILEVEKVCVRSAVQILEMTLQVA